MDYPATSFREDKKQRNLNENVAYKRDKWKVDEIVKNWSYYNSLILPLHLTQNRAL